MTPTTYSINLEQRTDTSWIKENRSVIDLFALAGLITGGLVHANYDKIADYVSPKPETQQIEVFGPDRAYNLPINTYSLQNDPKIWNTTSDTQ